MLENQINLEDWARSRKTHRQRFLLSEMERLGPSLHHLPIEPERTFVEGAFEFGMDEDGWGFVRGKVEGSLILTCQRCLGAVWHAAELEFKLCLIADETKLKTMPQEYDPLILKEFSGRLQDIVEDELLLNLPIVVFHPQGECQLEASAQCALEKKTTSETLETQKPFAELKNHLHQQAQ